MRSLIHWALPCFRLYICMQPEWVLGNKKLQLKEWTQVCECSSYFFPCIVWENMNLDEIKNKLQTRFISFLDLKMIIWRVQIYYPSQSPSRVPQILITIHFRYMCSALSHISSHEARDHKYAIGNPQFLWVQYFLSCRFSSPPFC